MSSGRAHHQYFEATPASTRAVRHTVAEMLESWGCDELTGEAILGASELATNAILHAREDFELAMRPIPGGIRIEIIDRRPDLVPIPVPTVGTATEVTEQGSTGRDLQIVAAIASRWGFNTSQTAKAVWMELWGDAPPEPGAPVVELGYQAAVDADARTFTLLSLPVRAAVASGGHVDDLVRELQLAAAPPAAPEERAHLNALLDKSAPARLHGRHAALDAAARGEDRFDLTVSLSLEALQAFSTLNVALNEFTQRIGRDVVPLDERVVAFRAWILDEVAAQVGGRAPEPCPLPS